MKTRFLLPALLCLTVSALAADTRGISQNARTVYHANGTYTMAVHDPATREQNEWTYSSQDVLLAHKKYLLNEQGQPLQGNVYDAKDVLKARAQFLYDQFGRLTEQRMYNLEGQVYQSITFNYDSNGRALTPKSQTFNVRAPDLKPEVLDFTNQRDAPRFDRNQGNVQPPTTQSGNVPYLPSTTQRQNARPDTSGYFQQNQPAQQPESGGKKPGLLGRLFGGKKKDEPKK